MMMERNAERPDIAKLSKHDRETLIEICEDIATKGRSVVDPNKREFREGVAVIWLFPLVRHLGISMEKIKERNSNKSDNISILSNSKRAKIESALDGLFTDFNIMVELNSNGQITHLEINIKGIVRSQTHLLDLPVPVGKLERLKQLVVHNCRSLPWWELAKLPDLEYMHLSKCSGDFFADLPPQVKLEHLKHLTICKCLGPLPLFPWSEGQLPSLEKLILTGDTTARGLSGAVSRSINDLTVRHQHDSLQKLELFGCGIDDDQLSTLLLEVVPKFPALSSLVLSHNNIRSLKTIAERIDDNRQQLATFRTSLRRLHLSNNSIVKFLQEDCEDRGEIAATCKFLDTFSTVSYLVGHGSWHRNIRQSLVLNWAGRRLLEGRNGSPLPLAVWPIVLARLTQPNAQWKANFWVDAMIDKEDFQFLTALFEMLRKSSVLLGGHR